MKKLNLENVEAIESNGNSNGYLLPIGGYFCKITAVEDVEDREFLKIFYDIANGEHKDFFATSNYPPSWIRSYKDSALGFFKGFVTALENSNPNFKFNEEDLNNLNGKFIGLIIGHEEYINKNGELKVVNFVDSCRSCQSIKDGDFKLPPLKKANKKPARTNNDMFSVATDDDDFPYDDVNTNPNLNALPWE